MRTRVCRFFQCTIRVAAALTLISPAGQACAVGFATDDASTHSPSGESLLDLAAQLERASLAGHASESHHTSIPRSEYRKFSGIGAIACSVAGVQSVATAFLVGGFDIAVTVAHAFEFDSGMAQPNDCEYLVYGPLGQIRERISVSRIHSQWRSEPKSFGRPDRDLAVIRLRSAARLPQRTLSFAKFASTGAPVALVGFSPELETDSEKRRVRGHVYVRPGNHCVKFAHDLESRSISSGAPVIDRRDGVVIGIHSYVQQSLTSEAGSCSVHGNAMLLMNDWLEHTLRAAISMKFPPTLETPAGY